MTSQVRRKLLKFIEDVHKLSPDDGPVYYRADSEPFEWTFYAFVVAWYDKTIDIIQQKELPANSDPISMLRTEHTDQVLKAVQEGKQIPYNVLREKRFKSEFYKPIRKYCRERKIDLDE